MKNYLAPNFNWTKAEKPEKCNRLTLSIYIFGILVELKDYQKRGDTWGYPKEYDLLKKVIYIKQHHFFFNVTLFQTGIYYSFIKQKF